jgi:ferredoxin
VRNIESVLKLKEVKMPWINVEDCTACGICVEECPVDTIVMFDEGAQIEMAGCIRCGVCHDICAEGAVKHDSEKIPEDIESNVKMTKEFMDLCVKYLGNEEEKIKCLKRMIKHFNRQKVIAERTLEKLEELKKEFDEAA